MHFTVPEGVQPGETLKLMTPRGGEVEVEVPMDAKVGKSFAVTIPASSSNDAPKKEASRISVTVPKGAKAGQVIKGRTPGGREFDVAVPAGVKPGKSFLVMVPLEEGEEPVDQGKKSSAPAPAPASPPPPPTLDTSTASSEVKELQDLFASGPPSARRHQPTPEKAEKPEPIVEEATKVAEPPAAAAPSPAPVEVSDPPAAARAPAAVEPTPEPEKPAEPPPPPPPPAEEPVKEAEPPATAEPEPEKPAEVVEEAAPAPPPSEEKPVEEEAAKPEEPAPAPPPEPEKPAVVEEEPAPPPPPAEEPAAKVEEEPVKEESAVCTAARAGATCS